MSNYAIQRNMVTMTEHEFNRIMSDLELFMKSSKLAEERVKLLEDTIRSTEKELKEKSFILEQLEK